MRGEIMLNFIKKVWGKKYVVMPEDINRWENGISDTVDAHNTHIADTTRHITQAERTSWNGRAMVSHTHNASDVNVGVLGADRIPNLPASRINSGTLGADRIPNLPASRITTGTLDIARIPIGTVATTVALGNHTHPAQTTITGNANTATTLQTTRTINGTNFNGSANITTSNWGTARNVTIGNLVRSVNGSANVAWSLADIGALPTNGGVMSGGITRTAHTGGSNWVNNRTNLVEGDSRALIRQQVRHSSSEFNPIVSAGLANASGGYGGTWTMGVFRQNDDGQLRFRWYAPNRTTNGTDADIIFNSNGTINAGAIPGLPGERITSGTVPFARLPIGTTATTVAVGNHGHGNATTTANGFMSSADKTRFDGVTPSTANPQAHGTATAGTSNQYSRADHRHPLQTTITGNAGSADRLSAARTISLTGGATGSVSTNLSGTANIAVTIPPTGHVHGFGQLRGHSRRMAVGMSLNNTELRNGGFYFGQFSDSPIGTGNQWSYLHVQQVAEVANATDTTECMQTVWHPTTPQSMWIRRSSNAGVWSAWARPVGDWNTLVNRPTTFAPAAHTHPFTAVTGVATIAQLPTGTTATTVALGNHGHGNATTSANGFMSSADKTRFDGMTRGTAAPRAAGTAAAGTSNQYSSVDHVHPLQTTITGNAATATRLQTARAINLTGAVTGAVTTDLGNTVNIATTVNHTHTAAQVGATPASHATDVRQHVSYLSNNSFTFNSVLGDYPEGMSIFSVTSPPDGHGWPTTAGMVITNRNRDSLTRGDQVIIATSSGQRWTRTTHASNVWTELRDQSTGLATAAALAPQATATVGTSRLVARQDHRHPFPSRLNGTRAVTLTGAVTGTVNSDFSGTTSIATAFSNVAGGANHNGSARIGNLIINWGQTTLARGATLQNVTFRTAYSAAPNISWNGAVASRITLSASSATGMTFARLDSNDYITQIHWQAIGLA